MKTFFKLSLLLLIIAYSAAEAITTTKIIEVFTKLNQQGLDIACGSEGDMCVAALDGTLQCYDFYRDEWEAIPLNEEISSISRVDIDDDGKILVVTDCAIYELLCDNTWNRLPGTAKDIGVGVNFDVWKIGTDLEGKNYGVWKLFCECDCNCTCSRVCLRFRKLSFMVCKPVLKRKCHWFRAEIRGINIDVFPNGDAAVVNADGNIFIVDAKTFEHKPLELKVIPSISVKAVDITVGNNGVIYVTGDDKKIYKYDPVNKDWIWISDATVDALRICASAFDLPTYVGSPGNWIYTSTRPGYLPCIEP